MNRRPGNSRPHPTPSVRFTAVELLVGSLLGLAGLTAAAQVLISHTHNRTALMQVGQRRSDWRKLTYQIALDVEADRQLATRVILPPSCGTGFSLLTLRTPEAATSTAPVPGDIHYLQTGTGSGSEIKRCGPSVGSSARPTPVISGVPVTVTVPPTCASCLRLSAAPSSGGAEEEHSLPPILLRPGLSASALEPSR
jgi:hypothetical protein